MLYFVSGSLFGGVLVFCVVLLSRLAVWRTPDPVAKAWTEKLAALVNETGRKKDLALWRDVQRRTTSFCVWCHSANSQWLIPLSIFDMSG